MFILYISKNHKYFKLQSMKQIINTIKQERMMTPNYLTPFSSRRTLFSISRNHLQEKKNFISENVYVGNLDPAVMTMPFGGTRCGTRMSPIGQSQHQHFRLIGTQHLAQAACSLICSQCNNGHADCVKCCLRINRKCW